MSRLLGWPNVLSPHDAGLAIEDVWPTLFFGAERIPEMRRKVERLPWAAAAFRGWRDEAEAVLGHGPCLPVEPAGWRHDFFSPSTSAHLRFEWDSPHAFTDPVDQSRHAGEAAHRAWVLLAHERTYRLMRSLGVLFALTADERYARWVAAGMRLAVETFGHGEYRQQHRDGALLYHPLYDAQALCLLANAYDLTRHSPAYAAADHDAIARVIFDESIPHQARFFEQRGVHNMSCYVAAALATAGAVFDREDWWRLALLHPASGYFALLKGGLPADDAGQVDGFWYEGTHFYHLYSLCALVPVREQALRAHAAGALAPAHAGGAGGAGGARAAASSAPVEPSGLGWRDAENRFRAMFGPSVELADARLRLPVFGDLGAPGVSNLALYRHLYEYAAGQVGREPFAPVLAAIYADGWPRTSLAAVAYGPDTLPQDAPRASGAAASTARAASIHLPAAGIAVLRAALPWDTTERAPAVPAEALMEVWFRCGLQRGSHDHPDRLSVCLNAAGEILAPDLGTAGYGLADYRAYCRSTFAHNTLLVDESDQRAPERVAMRAGHAWATGVLEGAYDGVRLERRVRLRPPFVLLEDVCVAATPRRFGWALHMPGSLAVTPGRTCAAPPQHDALPALPDTGAFGLFTNRHTGVADGSAGDLLKADWRIRDGLWVRLLAWSDGALEWTSGSTPGNPIPERRGSLFLRAVGERRRFRAALEIHRGASSLDTAWEGIFDVAPLDDVDSAATK